MEKNDCIVEILIRYYSRAECIEVVGREKVAGNSPSLEDSNVVNFEMFSLYILVHMSICVVKYVRIMHVRNNFTLNVTHTVTNIRLGVCTRGKSSVKILSFNFIEHTSVDYIYEYSSGIYWNSHQTHNFI